MTAVSNGLSQRLVGPYDEVKRTGYSLNSPWPSCALPEGLDDGLLPCNRQEIGFLPKLGSSARDDEAPRDTGFSSNPRGRTPKEEMKKEETGGEERAPTAVGPDYGK